MQVMWEWKVVKDVTLHYESKFIQLYLSVYASKYLQSIQKKISSLSLSLSLSMQPSSLHPIILF